METPHPKTRGWSALCLKVSVCVSTSESCIAPRGVWVELEAFLWCQGSVTWFHPMLESWMLTAVGLQCLLGHLLLTVICSRCVSCTYHAKAALVLLSKVCAADPAWVRGWGWSWQLACGLTQHWPLQGSPSAGFPCVHRRSSLASLTTTR